MHLNPSAWAALAVILAVLIGAVLGIWHAHPRTPLPPPVHISVDITAR